MDREWTDDEVRRIVLVAHMQGWRQGRAGLSRGRWTPERLMAQWPDFEPLAIEDQRAVEAEFRV